MINNDDSSSFCSPYTHTSLSVSRTPDRNPVALQCLSESLHVAPAFKTPLSAVTEETETQNKRQRYIHISGKGEAHRTGPTLYHVQGKPLQDHGLENGKDRPDISKKEYSTERQIVLNFDDNDDDTSSIKFAVGDAVSQGSQSPTTSSIVFIRDPSEGVHCEVGVSSRPMNSNIVDANTVQKDVPQRLPLSELNKDVENNTSEDTKRADDVQEIGPWCSGYKAQSFQGHMRTESDKSRSYVMGDDDTRKTRERNRRSDSDSIRSRPQSSDRESYGGSRSGSRGKKSNPCSKDSSFFREHSRGSTACKTNGKKIYVSGTMSSRSCNSDISSGTHKRLLTSPNRMLTSPRSRGFRSTTRTRSNSAVSRLQCDTALGNTTCSSPALQQYKQYRLLGSPLRRRPEQKATLLALLNDEMDALRTKLKEHDMEMEFTMLRSPFERLYHMNNRRDRDERRCRILHYMKLADAKETLLTENEEKENQRRAWRRESARRRKELFDRLYNDFSSRLNNSRVSSERNLRNKSVVTNDALFERLYNEALESMAVKQERVQREEMRRKQKEMDDALHTRILARLELGPSTRRVLTPQQKEARARSIQRELVQDPEKLEAYLKTNCLSKKEEELLASRLSRRRYSDAAKLASKKEEKELEGCTFHPMTNKTYNRRRGLSSGNYTGPTVLSSTRSRKCDTETTPAASSSRRGSRIQKNACELLYKKAVSQRAKAKVYAEEADKQKRLALLKGRLKEDHHFRRRVQLDPSLAERFMASLVV